MPETLPPLRPCPFCGCASLVIRFAAEDGGVPQPDVPEDDIIWCQILCPRCGATLRTPGTLVERPCEAAAECQAGQAAEPAPSDLGCHGRYWQVLHSLQGAAAPDYEEEDDCVRGCSVSRHGEILRLLPAVQREPEEDDETLCERAYGVWEEMFAEEISRRGTGPSILCERWNRRNGDEPTGCPFCGWIAEFTIDRCQAKGEQGKSGDAAYELSRLGGDGECFATGPVVYREEGESDEHLEDRVWELWLKRVEAPSPPS